MRCKRVVRLRKSRDGPKAWLGTALEGVNVPLPSTYWSGFVFIRCCIHSLEELAKKV